MEDTSIQYDYFWPSYVDFMMVLVFIAFACGGTMYIEYKKKSNSYDAKLRSLKDSSRRLEVLERYQHMVDQVIKVNESLKKECIAHHIRIDALNKEKIKLEGDYYFKKDSFSLRHEKVSEIRDIGNSFLSVLNRDSNYLKYIIIVEGHADSDGDIAHNNLLSFKRALAITSIWADSCGLGLPKYEIIPAGYGKFKPAVVEYGLDSNKALNRRIEISIVPKLSEFTKMLHAKSNN